MDKINESLGILANVFENEYFACEILSFSVEYTLHFDSLSPFNKSPIKIVLPGLCFKFSLCNASSFLTFYKF